MPTHEPIQPTADDRTQLHVDDPPDGAVPACVKLTHLGEVQQLRRFDRWQEDELSGFPMARFEGTGKDRLPWVVKGPKKGSEDPRAEPFLTPDVQLLVEDRSRNLFLARLRCVHCRDRHYLAPLTSWETHPVFDLPVATFGCPDCERQVRVAKGGGVLSSGELS